MGMKECPYGRTCKYQHELQHLGKISVLMLIVARNESDFESINMCVLYWRGHKGHCTW
jgi:hypothetical protein